MSLEKYRALLSRENDIAAERRKLAKTVIYDSLHEFIVGRPDLIKFSWTQSHHSNDEGGSYFYVNAEEPDYEGELSDEDLNELYSLINGFTDDDLERVFGSYVRITVTKTSIMVDEYY